METQDEPIELPGEFWEFIDACSESEETCASILEKLSQDQMIRYNAFYSEATTEIFWLLHSECQHLTESSITELSDAIVTRGREEFERYFRKDWTEPDASEVEVMPNYAYLFDRIYYDRFEEEIPLLDQD